MNYLLMHKDIAVAELEIDEDLARIAKIGEVYDYDHCPLGIDITKGRIDRAGLDNWWAGRAIPASRSGIREALETLDISSPKMLLTKCYGLSLSDQYWVNPLKNPLKWEQVNFFGNPFSEDIGNVLFGTIENAEGISLVSPDNTSDGNLRKKWKIIDGKRCLIKGGSEPAYQEPLNEVLASAVMRRLGINHVPYTVIMDNEQPYSVCENLVTPQTELISAWHILQTRKKSNSVSWHQHFIDCCEKLGIPNAQAGIDRMLSLDYIIANTDRHANNFGAVRNAETLEWIGIAPIYDSGTSLWHGRFTKMIRAHEKVSSKPFRKTHDEQIKLVKDFDWFEKASLYGISDEFDEILKISPAWIDGERRNVLCRALESRIKMLCGHIEKSARLASQVSV